LRISSGNNLCFASSFRIPFISTYNPLFFYNKYENDNYGLDCNNDTDRGLIGIINLSTNAEMGNKNAVVISVPQSKSGLTMHNPISIEGK
jgi:hypothetical protein